MGPRGSSRRPAELLAGLYESIPEGIYVGALEAAGVETLSANPHLKLMFGFDPDEPDDRVRPFAADRFLDDRARADFIARLRRDGAVSNYLVRLRRVDGSPMWVEVTAALHAAEDSPPPRLDALVRDVSERRKLEAQGRDPGHELVQSEKMAALGQTISGVAHELNNPLATILTCAERLAARPVEAETKRGVETILGEAERAAKIVRNLLTFARKRNTTRAFVDMNEIVHDTLASRAYEQRVSNISTLDALAGGLPPIFSDPHQVKQVLLNLIINAEQAMLAANGRGSLVARSWYDEAQDMVTLEINDDGPGIPEDVRNRIFDPFFTTKAIGKGTGLGLTVAYAIVQEHGGRIRVESTPGDGAVVLRVVSRPRRGVPRGTGGDPPPRADRRRQHPARGGRAGPRGGGGRLAGRRRLPRGARRRRRRGARACRGPALRPRHLRPEDAAARRTRVLPVAVREEPLAGPPRDLRHRRRGGHRCRALPRRERMPMAGQAVPAPRPAPHGPRGDGGRPRRRHRRERRGGAPAEGSGGAAGMARFRLARRGSRVTRRSTCGRRRACRAFAMFRRRRPRPAGLPPGRRRGHRPGIEVGAQAPCGGAAPRARAAATPGTRSPRSRCRSPSSSRRRSSRGR